ncbi:MULTISPECIES: transaldolase family protein [Caldisericum]|jgi:transaldolase|uniref:Transaldolase n=1 Tax=Caldisericum exile TaxID=693075 RepID=A0A2J6WEN3_9BACT|nr:MAG: transaldolase [Caldisericum exile]
MKIFIDTADIEEIRTAISWGIVDGVTTNPTLIKKALQKYRGKISSMEEYIKEILRTAGRLRPVSLEVISTDKEKMVKEATILYEKFNYIANNVVVKIPINPNLGEGNDFDGVMAVKELKSLGIPTNVTLVMTPEQAVLAAKVGADYVSPFVGRVDDYLRAKVGIEFKKEDYFPSDGMEYDDELINDNGIVSGVHMLSIIKEIFANYRFSTKIIAASVRNARQVREILEIGCDVATIPFYVLKDMIKHTKTEEGMINFVKDVEFEYKEIFWKGE